MVKWYWSVKIVNLPCDNWNVAPDAVKRHSRDEASRLNLNLKN
jgi:hypothetical protein